MCLIWLCWSRLMKSPEHLQSCIARLAHCLPPAGCIPTSSLMTSSSSPLAAFSFAILWLAEPGGRAYWQSSGFHVFLLALAFFKFYFERLSFSKGLHNHSVQMQRERDTLGRVPSPLCYYVCRTIHCPGMLMKVVLVAAAALKNTRFLKERAEVFALYTPLSFPPPVALCKLF